MSSNNTAHVERARPDELVPSRYALRIGDIEVLIISDDHRDRRNASFTHARSRPGLRSRIGACSSRIVVPTDRTPEHRLEDPPQG